MESPNHRILDTLLTCDIPSRGHRVHFLETLHALSGHVAGAELSSKDEVGVHSTMWDRLPHGEGAEAHQSAYFYSAMYIAAAMKGYVARQHLKPIWNEYNIKMDELQREEAVKAKDATAKGWGNIAKRSSMFPKRMVAAAGALGSMARGQISSVAKKTTNMVMVAGQAGGAEVRRMFSTTTQASNAASAKAISAFNQVTRLGHTGLQQMQARRGEWGSAFGAEGQGAASAVMGAARREGSQLMGFFSRFPAHHEFPLLPAVGLRMDRLVHAHAKTGHAGRESGGAVHAHRQSTTAVTKGTE